MAVYDGAQRSPCGTMAGVMRPMGAGREQHTPRGRVRFVVEAIFSALPAFAQLTKGDIRWNGQLYPLKLAAAHNAAHIIIRNEGFQVFDADFTAWFPGRRAERHANCIGVNVLEDA